MFSYLHEGEKQRERVCYGQIKLASSARRWLDRQQDYAMSWDELKSGLRAAFPHTRDPATSLEELLERHKLPSETMSRHYHDKMALCAGANIDKATAVSCLIRGLPAELRANAYSCRCETPDALYVQFLSGLDEYQTPGRSTTGAVPRTGRYVEAAAGRGTGATLRLAAASGYRATSSAEASVRPPSPKRNRCFNCQVVGTHISRDCPLRQASRRRGCGEEGHQQAQCGKRTRPNAPPSKKVRLVSTDKAFKRLAKGLHGEDVKVYLDTGSEYNLMSEACAERLCIVPRPASIHLHGFGGGLAEATSEDTVTLQLDGIDLPVTVAITSADLSNADVVSRR